VGSTGRFSRQKIEEVKAGVRAKCESQIGEARGKTEAKGERKNRGVACGARLEREVDLR
jgi:hypothetical protein